MAKSPAKLEIGTKDHLGVKDGKRKSISGDNSDIVSQLSKVTKKTHFHGKHKEEDETKYKCRNVYPLQMLPKKVLGQREKQHKEFK